MSPEPTPTLYLPDRHIAAPRAARAQTWLRRFAADALAAAAQGPWPAHPRDVSDAPEQPGPFHCLYFGGLGVWPALVRLADAGPGLDHLW